MDVCPGCGVRYPAWSGPTHAYIGASAACWSTYTTMNAGGDPSPPLIAGSTVARAIPASGKENPSIAANMFVDAYAAQHHGLESRRAIQSVCIHLLVLHGVFKRGKKPADAMWIRVRTLRNRGIALHWLTPPPLGEALSIRHLFPGGGVDQVASRADYVASVHDSWNRLHGPQLDEWYERFVLSD
jgi:hypothetical protein